MMLSQACPSVHTRLGGYARQEIVLGQLDELNGLLPRDGRESSEEILQGGIAFNMVDQRLNRNARTLKAGCAAQALSVDPHDFIE